MDKIKVFKAVDRFRDDLMDEFLSLCNYNDYNKINLLVIGETINKVYDDCIGKLVEEQEYDSLL